MKIEELTLKKKIGQMMIIRLQGKEVSKQVIKMIKEYNIGGIVLYRKNYDTYEEMENLINKIIKINKECNNIPLFICVDQEGGRVNRMPYEIKNLRSARRIADKNDLELVKKAGKVTAEMLKKSGFNMNFAPVLDIQRFEDDHAIGNRCYGDSIEEVSKNALEVMNQLSKGGVIPVVKHFPGHGATLKDSHWFLPRIDKDIKQLETEDMVPFENAIKQNAEVIMVGHLKIKSVDKRTPASLSKNIINNYLINKYNYKGLIMTDDLKMRAISLWYGYARACLKACKAGNDLILIGTPYYIVKRAIRKIERNVKLGLIDEKDIEKRVEKIVKLKEKYNIENEFACGCDINKINEEIEKINEKIEQA